VHRVKSAPWSAKFYGAREPVSRPALQQGYSRETATGSALRALARSHSAGGVQGSLVTRIVLRVHIFEAQRSKGRYLSDVLAGLCPVKVPRITGPTDDAAGWICLDLIAVESIAQADLEKTGHDRIDSVLGVPSFVQPRNLLRMLLDAPLPRLANRRAVDEKSYLSMPSIGNGLHGQQ
jgi:hypothetical protein